MHYYRLNSAATKMWLINPTFRRRLGGKLSYQYRSGVGICSATLRLIAYVQPNGAIRELPPPHQERQMHEMSNAPKPKRCACFNFWDPESGGSWGERGESSHHPHCQFNPLAAPSFQLAQQAAAQRIKETGGMTREAIERRRDAGVQLQKRPDEWTLIQEQVKNS